MLDSDICKKEKHPQLTCNASPQTQGAWIELCVALHRQNPELAVCEDLQTSSGAQSYVCLFEIAMLLGSVGLPRKCAR